MSRFFNDTFAFDFGDDESGIWWDASVTVDTDYDSVHSYSVGNVHIGGKRVGFSEVDSDMRDRIRDRMNVIETCDFLP